MNYVKKCALALFVVLAQFALAKPISFDKKTFANTDFVTVVQPSHTARVEGSGFGGAFCAGRTVLLSSYALAKHEVTQELYSAVMGVNPSNYQVAGGKGDILPVENVSWYDAIVFCNLLTEKTLGARHCVYYANAACTILYTKEHGALLKKPYMNNFARGYRLPTDAEWEYAARGANASIADWTYAYAGAGNYIEEVGWYSANAYGVPHATGTKMPNRLGLYDMSGNVQEWCWDYYGDMDPGVFADPKGPISGNYRIRRGGSFDDFEQSCLASYQHYLFADEKSATLGFRLCQSLFNE